MHNDAMRKILVFIALLLILGCAAEDGNLEKIARIPSGARSALIASPAFLSLDERGSLVRFLNSEFNISISSSRVESLIYFSGGTPYVESAYKAAVVTYTDTTYEIFGSEDAISDYNSILADGRKTLAENKELAEYLSRAKEKIALLIVKTPFENTRAAEKFPTLNSVRLAVGSVEKRGDGYYLEAVLFSENKRSAEGIASALELGRRFINEERFGKCAGILNVIAAGTGVRTSGSNVLVNAEASEEEMKEFIPCILSARGSV